MKGQVASAVRSSHVCTTCQRGFCSKTSLARHVRAASNGERTNCHGLNKKRAASNNLGNCAADEHPTPEWLWQELVDAYPDLRTMKIWDPFYCDGASKKLMHKAGMMNVRHSKHDFFAALDAPFRTSTYTIVTNPPFSIKKRILHELEARGRAYIMLLPVHVLFRKYFLPIRHKCKFIFPSKTWIDESQNRDCVFVCRRCGPPESATWVHPSIEQA
jgi:hypothetical protein